MIFDDSILNELWNGNIFPQEYLLNTDNKEINEVSSTLDKMHFELADKIDNNLFDKFNKYEKEGNEMNEKIAC